MIEDRRPFTPRSIRGCLFWLRAGHIAGIVGGGVVASWGDPSGHNTPVTQGTPAARPTYQTAVLNGRPVVRFDAVDDALSHATALQLAGSTGLTIAAVVTIPAVLAMAGAIIARDAAGNRGWNLVVRETDGLVSWLVSSSAVSRARRDADLDIRNSTRVVTAVFAGGATQSIYIDGTLHDGAIDAAIPATVGNNGPAVQVGSDGYGEFFKQDIAEIAVYNRALATAERQRLERHLGRLYGVTVA